MIQSKKFELLAGEDCDRMVVDGHTLYQVIAVSEFGNVPAGSVGGWVESEDNLSQFGNCWITDMAAVYNGATVTGDALVTDEVLISGKVIVDEHTLVSGDAVIKVTEQQPKIHLIGNTRIAAGAFIQSEKDFITVTLSNSTATFFKTDTAEVNICIPDVEKPTKVQNIPVLKYLNEGIINNNITECRMYILKSVMRYFNVTNNPNDMVQDVTVNSGMSYKAYDILKWAQRKMIDYHMDPDDRLAVVDLYMNQFIFQSKQYSNEKFFLNRDSESRNLVMVEDNTLSLYYPHTIKYSTYDETGDIATKSIDVSISDAELHTLQSILSQVCLEHKVS